ncbi:DUF3231 family protein [Cohnella thailandensis]|uniref:DUF3231 family protein n=1 Tax=Cohnella thailandensis TaxID=557557 RepID=A0A841SXZ4_9BACL|nr:DUF3231 family protein [Cohnella thailandensis]MBB6635048.1 DUF3231 family protein [Cohnella thailandensis]MBP1975728.1 hypothetical protein [Cohnella thailandensis]
MANVMEAVTQIFKTLVNDQPEPPIHAGEVMDLWKYAAYIEEAIVLEQIGRNTTIDNDLLKLLDEAVTICSAQSERIQKMMEEFGIPIPPMPSDKPKSEAGAVPAGARMTDDEIANILAAKLLLVTKECCRSMLEAVRSDLGLMWANMLYEQAKFGANLKVKMRERGWLKSPPAYYPPGAPNQ